MQAAREIEFGQFRLDLTNECLWRGTRAISLRPKAFAVLKILIENPGQLVSKEKVLDSVWPGTFVGDGVLKDNIRQLREALNDDAGSPAYIETAHRRGYRFIGKIAEPVPATQSSEIPISGGSKRIPVYRSSAKEMRVLGREAELAKLRGWFDRAYAGDRQVVFVTGEAGIGKTTLVQAFIAELEELSNIRVARGQCLERYGAGEAYLPLLDGFSRLCRLPGGDPVLTVLRHQAPAWLAQMPSLVPQSERANLQAQAMGATRERILREMAEAIETLSSETALVLLLEDLHWSDYSTVDLVSYLARRRDPARLMIGTYRPVDVIVADHPLKGGKRELQAHGLCRELALECLSEEVVAEFLSARFPRHQFPARLRQTVYRRTEGTPLFMVNLVEYLADQQAIVEEQGSWKLRAELSEVERGVPSNLRDLIQKQIERLSPDERTVLEAASVAGMECSSVAIAAGLENTVEWVEEYCEELARRHQFLSPAWLVQLPNGSVTPRHRFIHVLYREVPYRMIPPMRRSQIHRRIAEHGVVIYGDRVSEIAAELAMHFEQSHDWPRALEYLLRSAENAVARSAHHEAADLVRRGLLVLKSLPKNVERDHQEIRLRMILSVSLMAMKGFGSAEVEQVYAEAKDLFNSSAPSPHLFNTLYLHGLFYITRGDITAALEIATQLLALADKLEDPMLNMEAHRAMGATLIELGRCNDSLEHFERALQIYSANRHHPYTLTIGHDCRVMTECSVARALWAVGFPDTALERIQTGLAFARELSHPQSLIGAAHLAAQLYQERGEPEVARNLASEVIKLADEHGLELWVALGKIDLGCAQAALGDSDGGISQMQQGLAAYDATGGRLWSPYFLGLLADALGKAGRAEEGRAAIEKALRLAEDTGERYSLAELYRFKGELILKSRGRKARVCTSNSTAGPCEISFVDQARDCFEQAMHIAEQSMTRSWYLRSALGLDRLEMSLGNSGHEQLAEIYSSFTEGFDSPDLKLAREQLTVRLGRHAIPTD